MNRLIYRGESNRMTDIMVDEFGITKEEFIQLHKKLLGTISPDELMENMRTIKSRYRLSASAMASLVYERLDLVASRDSLNKLMQIQARYGIKDEQIASLLGSWRVKFLTSNVEYLTRIEKEVGLTRTEMNSIVRFSKLPYYTMEPKHIKRNIEILEQAGLDRKELWRGVSILSCKPKRLVDLIMLGMLNGQDIATFVKTNNHRTRTDVAYARMMAVKDGLIPSSAVYLSDEEFAKVTNGLDRGDLTRLYGFGPLQKIDVEKEFVRRFPNHIGLIETMAQDFIDYANQEGRKNGIVGPEGAEANKDFLKERFEFNDRSIESLIKVAPDILTTDNGLFRHNLSTMSFLVGREHLARTLFQNPKLLTDDTNALRNIFEFLHSNYGVTRSEFSWIILRDPSFVCLDRQQFEDNIQFLKENYGMDKKGLKSLILHAPRMSYKLSKDAFKNKLDLLAVFGVRAGDLEENAYSILGNSLANIEYKFKLGLLNKLSPNEIVSDKVSFAPAKVYAHMMATAKEELKPGHIYASSRKIDELARLGAGLPQDVILNKYKFDENAIAKVDTIFARNFSEIQAKLELFKKGLEEIEVESMTDAQNLALSKLDKRLKRICGLSDEQLETLKRGVGVLTEYNVGNIALNFHNLMNMGFDVEEIIKMPKILKTSPKETRIKAMLSRLAGKSDAQFIKRNYTYSSASVYAKLEEVKEQGIGAANIYDGNEDFERYLFRDAGQTCTVNFLKTIHPLDDKAVERLEGEYLEKFPLLDSGSEEEM